MPISLLGVGGLCANHKRDGLYGRGLRVKAEECGFTHSAGDTLRPLLDVIERSVGRDASRDYRVPVTGIRVRPLLEKRVQRVEDERGGDSAVCGVQLAP